MHRCGAVYVETVPVHEVFKGKTVWKGEVEVFIVTHPRANHCYAWSYHDDKGERIVAILEIPPVGDAKTAVQASILADSKKH